MFKKTVFTADSKVTGGIIPFFANATDASMEWQHKFLEEKELLTYIVNHFPNDEIVWIMFCNIAQHPGLLFSCFCFCFVSVSVCVCFCFVFFVLKLFIKIPSCYSQATSLLLLVVCLMIFRNVWMFVLCCVMKRKLPHLFLYENSTLNYLRKNNYSNDI
jgi:hypothetical protein